MKFAWQNWPKTKHFLYLWRSCGWCRPAFFPLHHLWLLNGEDLNIFNKTTQLACSAQCVERQFRPIWDMAGTLKIFNPKQYESCSNKVNSVILRQSTLWKHIVWISLNHPSVLKTDLNVSFHFSVSLHISKVTWVRWEDGWNIRQKMPICNSHFLMGAMTDILLSINIDIRSLLICCTCERCTKKSFVSNRRNLSKPMKLNYTFVIMH